MGAAGRLGQDELSLPGGSFAVGDIVVVKRNDPRAGLHNGDRAVVSAIDRARSTIELDCDGRRINVGPAFLYARTAHGDATLVHGYAITGHIAQGLTVDRAFVLAQPGLTREWGYTALTRGREANHLYLGAEGDTQRHEYAPAAPRETRTDALTALARALSADSAHHLALDATEAAQTEARARRPLSEKADDFERLRQRQLGRERKPRDHGIDLGL
jgi:ATP-dependent exoDNAse (exonuclease V) alpha subunit